MKRQLLMIFVTTISAWAAPLSANNDDCALLNWPTVTGGSQMTPIDFGICEYEVDFEGGRLLSYVQYNIDLQAQQHNEHWMRFSFNGSRFDTTRDGHFRIMDLITDDAPDMLLAVDMYWRGSDSGDPVLWLEGRWQAPVIGPMGLVDSGSICPLPADLDPGFSINVDLKWIPTNPATQTFAKVELWVDGVLLGSLDHVWMPFQGARPPIAVRFGIVQVFEEQTRGTLVFAPIQPSPLNPVF